MDYIEKYNSWLLAPDLSEDIKAEIFSIKDNEKEIKERFYKDLEFGTGGLRGLIGAGTNRINIYTIQKATQGFANYLLSQDYNGKNPEDMGVAIAYDPRKMSKEFAESTALVLNGNKIKTYIFESLRPTPELSFTIRYLGCAGGIVITASHNPAEYNGYKVYDCDGGQVAYPKDGEIINEVNKVDNYLSIKVADKKKALENGLFNIIGKEIDDKYINEVKTHILNTEIVKNMADRLKIVYTPLNGTGHLLIKRILEETGFKSTYIVKEQAEPDSNFTTVGYPNPEDPNAFKLALKLAKEVDGDIIIATDPDADRMGCMVKNKDGEYIHLTGNMIGVLFTEYILKSRKNTSNLPKNSAIISTIVSSRLTKVIAEDYNAKYIDVLTGFKYIGEKINGFEKDNSNSFLFGFEESYGYLAGTHSRDKDAVEATLLFCEMALYYKSIGMTVLDGLEGIYKKYGYFIERVESITLKGISGKEKINKIMGYFRNDYSIKPGEFEANTVEDFYLSKKINLKNKKEEIINLPVSNVLYYTNENDEYCCIRPSGTEPKIKIYFGVKADNKENAEERISKLFENFMKVIE